MRSRSRLTRLVVVALALPAALTAGCVHVFWKTDVRPLARPAPGAPRSILSPLRAHLRDGTTVVFPQGGTVTDTDLRGVGTRYSFAGDSATVRAIVPLDSVVGMEYFEGRMLGAPTLAVSVAATALGVVGGAALALAVLGSCPTVYADTGAAAPIQAEGFSYAIAPLFEHRDVDPLRVRAGPDGVVRLELRNEALETHYLNHVELLAVRHATGARVVPDQEGRPVLVAGERPLARATDRAGRDVRGALASADDSLFASAPATVEGARVGDLDDWIDVEAADLPPGDSVAVVLRLRNSLLNTVLLYDGILGGRDAPDWLASGLQHIATAVDVSRWYVRTMGMRVELEGAPAVRVGDAGPIAFRDVAIVLPRPTPNATRVRARLRFVADNWRIDRVALAAAVSRPETARLAVARVVVPTPAAGRGPVLDTAAVTAVADADDRYLETRPGQRMTLEFARDPRPPAGDSATTYLLGWQGWYREWIRGSWLAAPRRTTPFVPGDSAVLAALGRWREQRQTLERDFYALRVPVQ